MTLFEDFETSDSREVVLAIATEGVIVVCLELTVVALIDDILRIANPPIRHHDLRQSRGVIKRLVEVVAITTNDTLTDIAVDLRGVSLLITVGHAILVTIAESSEGGESKLRDGLPVDGSLQREVSRLVVTSIVLELVLDIERRVVIRIEGIGIQRTAGSRSIATGAPVTTIVHLAVGGRRADTEAPALEGAEVSVEVERVGLRVLVLIPPWVEVSIDRSIVVRLLRTRREGQGVLMTNAVLEELLEPVRITELSSTEVSRTTCIGIEYTVLATLIIVIIDAIVEVAVDPILRGDKDSLVVKALTISHLIEDGHLVLRVQDIILAIGGDGTISKLGLISEGVSPLPSLTRADGDNPPEGALTIESGSRSVVDDLEALDVALRETGQSSCDEALSFGRCKVGDVEVLVFLVDHSIDDPQGIVDAFHRCSLTHRDDRSGLLLFRGCIGESNLHGRGRSYQLYSLLPCQSKDKDRLLGYLN